MTSRPQPHRSWVPLRLWSGERSRAVFIQLLAAGLVLGFFWFILNNTATNLEKRGIASGFGFLDEPAGFDVAMHLISFDMSSTHGRVFFVGALNTLLVSFFGIIGATFLGISIGVARLSPNWIVAKLATVYVETLRNIPLLVQIWFWYFGIVLLTWPKVRESWSIADSIFVNRRGIEIPRPVFEVGAVTWALALLAILIGLEIWRRWAKIYRERTGTVHKTGWVICGVAVIGFALGAYIQLPMSWDIPVKKGFNFQGGLSVLPSLIALWLALTTYTAAFIAENVRSGILSVANGQREAAAALGLRPNRIMRLIVLPQALRVAIPPITSQYLNLTKNSSLAVAATYPDIVNVFSGTTLTQTGQAVEVIAMTMGFYLAISLLISAAMNFYNSRVVGKGGTAR